VQCTGKAQLKKIKWNGTSVVTYIIGCEKYVSGDKWHRYMKIPDDIDLTLLTSLFEGTHIVSIKIQLLLFNFYLFITLILLGWNSR